MDRWIDLQPESFGLTAGEVRAPRVRIPGGIRTPPPGPSSKPSSKPSPWASSSRRTEPVETATIFGWGQYQRQVGQLPPDQQARLKRFADAIRFGFQAGAPVRSVSVTGHADQDTPRNPPRERQFSIERAQVVADWLNNYLGPALGGRIKWRVSGAGATQLKAPPTSESNRRQNRRVELAIGRGGGTGGERFPVCAVPLTADPAFMGWLQAALGQVLGGAVTANVSFGPAAALASYQRRKGLRSSGSVEPATIAALVADGCPAPPCLVPATARTLDPVTAPTPILMPPLRNTPGPKGHPALPKECPDGGFFGDPPTRGQSTSGTVLDAAEVASRRNDIATAIAKAKTARPLSAANLQRWLDRSGTPLVISSAPFRNGASGVPSFLEDRARPMFEQGCKARLQNANHPQGTLLPSSLTRGSTGPVRFLQFEDGTGPVSAVRPPLAADLFTAVGSFNVHSVIWAQATFVEKTGGILGIGSSDVFDVKILKWCVQIYDVYDWNAAGFTPFPMSDAELAQLRADFPLPGKALKIVRLGNDVNMVIVRDEYFRDLEVSGGGRAFLVRSETFDAPQFVMRSFAITI